MDRRINLPVFGLAPKEYDYVYLDDLSRKLNLLIAALRSPGEGRQSRLVITDLTTSDSGLEPGTLFQIDGVVRISLANKPYVSGVSGNGLVGVATVTIV